jgi:hypothetical protein
MAAFRLLSRTVFLLGSAAALSAGAADAQCRLCSTPTTSRDGPEGGDDIRLDIETSLNFDRLIVSGGGHGTAVIRPDGSTSAQGAVSNVSPRAMVGSAVVHGQPGRAVRVELPRRIQLFSMSGGQISFDDVVSDLPSIPRLDATGSLTFRFGGRLSVTGDADGDYRGDFPITVEYL